jgi:hypothetical protein
VPLKKGAPESRSGVDPHNFLQSAKEFWSHTFNVTSVVANSAFCIFTHPRPI